MIFSTHSLALHPDQADIYNNLGALLKDQKRLIEAEDAYRRAFSFQPNNSDVLANLGILLQERKHIAEAEKFYQRALSLYPDHVVVLLNLGILFQEKKRFAEAETLYQQALTLKPDYPEALMNLGNLFQGIKRFTEAETLYQQALAFKPDYPEAKWNLSLSLLSRGRFEEGWPLYEARFDTNLKEILVNLPNLNYPQWEGESLIDKSIVIYSEQGFGDIIQFARYFQLLKNRGAKRITLICHPSLSPLLHTVPGVDQFVHDVDIEKLEPHDFWTFPLSLPHRFQTTLETIPANLPYLTASRDKLGLRKEKLSAGFTIGLAWKGSDKHKNDSNRSLSSLEILKPLWAIPGISFVSLQLGYGENGTDASLPDQPIFSLNQDIQDFADTAAIISQLDLVISVDTSIVHLAGALGKPCWVLLPYIKTDWRWLHEREDSPWYPKVMRLFRQKNIGDWESVIKFLAEELRKIVTQHTNQTGIDD